MSVKCSATEGLQHLGSETACPSFNVVSVAQVHIHSPVARTFFCCTVCLRTSAHLHARAHARMAQVSVKRCLHMCHISPSRLLLSHVSPSILAVPARSLRDHLPVRTVLVGHTCRESAGHAHLRSRTSSLAIWPFPPSTQVTSSTSSTRQRWRPLRN